jgi:hypothetical protein
MSDPNASSPGVLATIGAAFRQNRVPCVLLNLVVIALVASYYLMPSVAGIWQAVGELKVRWSYAFSWASTISAAVVLPSLVQWWRGVLPVEGRGKRVMLLALFWGYRGMEIDLFYRVMGWFYGQGRDATTLIKKVATDQFLMSPLWFVPTYLIALRWVDHGGSISRTRASLNRDFWLHTCPTVLVTNWLIWVPTLALVYSLPPALQFPLFAVVMTFFILLVTLMASERKAQP